MLGSFLALYHVVRNLADASNNTDMCNLRLILSYYENYPYSKVEEPLLPLDFIASVQERVDSFFRGLRFESAEPGARSKLKSYLATGVFPQQTGAADPEALQSLFGCYLSFYGMPSVNDVAKVGGCANFTPDKLPFLARSLPQVPAVGLLRAAV
jgi:hypothetical protein